MLILFHSVLILCSLAAFAIDSNAIDSNAQSSATSSADHGLAPPFGSYAQHSYAEITDELQRLADGKCSEILFVTTGQELYKDRPDILLNAPFFDCGGKQCVTQIVRVASKTSLQADTPELFFSGALHGDERIGPNTLFEFVRLVCHMYGKHPIVTFLVDTRAVWMTPVSNAWGYAHNKREENKIDPNRDFPYQRKPAECMATITGRVLNELFMDHLFQLAITFHGGTRLLSYEWGSFDHLNGTKKLGSPFFQSLESPDLRSQESIATALQTAAGWLNPDHRFQKKENYDYLRQLQDRAPAPLNILQNAEVSHHLNHSNSRHLGVASNPWDSVKDGPEAGWFYPIGSMSDLVYPVDGGFEDWSYSASWQSAPDPISVCAPTTYGGYPRSKSIYAGSDSLRASTFLVETDYFKSPPDWQYGHSAEVMQPSGLDGHIPRNLRLVLKLIELVQPDVLLLQTPKIVPADTPHDINFRLTDDTGHNNSENPENENPENGNPESGSSQKHDMSAQFNVSFSLLPVGCDVIDSLEVILLRGRCDSNAQQSLSHQQSSSNGGSIQHSLISVQDQAGVNSSVKNSGSSGAPLPVGRVIPLVTKASKCSQIGLWEKWAIDPETNQWTPDSLERGGVIKVNFAITGEELNEGGVCIFARGVFDQHWGAQVAPDPPLPPQTHVARTRLLDNYSATAGNQSIHSSKVKIFPMRNSWGTKWADGVHLTRPLPEAPSLQNDRTPDPPNNSSTLGHTTLQFRTDAAAASKLWAIDFTSGRKLESSTPDLEYWDPFQNQMRVSGAHLSEGREPEELKPTRTASNGKLVDEIQLTISRTSLHEIPGPAEFVVRLWDGSSPASLGHRIVPKSSNNKIEKGDGEFLRWNISSAENRYQIRSESKNLGQKFYDEEEGSLEDIVVRFEPRTQLSWSSLEGRVLTLEFYNLQNGSSLIKPASVSSALIPFTPGGRQYSSSLPPNSVPSTNVPSNSVCIFTSPNQFASSFITSNAKLSADWFLNPRAVETIFERQTGGFLFFSNSTKHATGRICRAKSNKDPSRDVVEIKSESGCFEESLRVERPIRSFLNPLISRVFTFDVDVLSHCPLGESLQLVLSNNASPVNRTVASCSILPTTASLKSFSRTFCEAKHLPPLDENAPVSPSQKIAVAGLGITFLFFAGMPILEVWRSRRVLGYSQVQAVQMVNRS